MSLSHLRTQQRLFLLVGILYAFSNFTGALGHVHNLRSTHDQQHHVHIEGVAGGDESSHNCPACRWSSDLAGEVPSAQSLVSFQFILPEFCFYLSPFIERVTASATARGPPTA